MALQELQHRYICGYKEFFVTWDKEEAAMFVCIVMEFYKNGDLERVLKQRRQTQQPIEELVRQDNSNFTFLYVQGSLGFLLPTLFSAPRASQQGCQQCSIFLPPDSENPRMIIFMCYNTI